MNANLLADKDGIIENEKENFDGEDQKNLDYFNPDLYSYAIAIIHTNWGKKYVSDCLIFFI